MNNSIANWLRLRTFLLRLALSFGLVLSLTGICGRFTTYVDARAGQPQGEGEEVKPKLKTERPRAPDRPITEGTIKKEGKLQEKLRPGTMKRQRRVQPEEPKPPNLLKHFSADPFAPSKERGKTSLNDIRIPPGLRGPDLRRVDKINKRFLLDVPMFDTSYEPLRLDDKYHPKQIVEPSQKEQFAKTIAITAAKLADGTEVLTVFDMHSSFETGSLVGRMEHLPKDTDNTKQVRKIVGEPGQGGRVFFYGNDLHNIDLTSIANDRGVELIRLTDKTRNLVSVQQRLDTIASRGFDPQRSVIINGLPDSRESVESMGPFAGPAERWLNFRESIDSSTPSSVKTTSERDVFVRELQQGDSDLLVLVAHSDGFYFYLNDSRMSLKEISALPDRQERSERPRLAVIISCNAGKANSPSLWKKILGRDYEPLGHMLVEKGFVDRVFAPDHEIGADEAHEAFDKALSGQPLAFKHWINLAVRVRALLGVPS